ncbi:MAG TPA: bifunctional transaldolase/phosoglucose isomerase [Candidatus Fraserbacteria bacterium]|nr:bifunctional transaldolase/phosoglucose isomerase [Candidatus Fraserbacteria bacterium]
MTNLNDLAQLGQAVWYDYIRRSFITSGELAKLIALGVRGVTSNPSILEKAIAGSADYDEELRRLVAAGKSVEEIYEALVFEDIGQAADLLLPVYQVTDKLDGYVSLEVSPELARDTAGTLDEARRLFAALNRPNLMIKVPATPEGIPAIAQLIGEGINVNVTLIFSLEQYEAAAQAYLDGLAALAAAGGDLHQVASVASFFVSRVDTAVDRVLDALDGVGARRAVPLQGKIAIANVKLAYRRFQEIFSGSRWGGLAAQGARVQRPLWASTSTKNHDYPDTLYLDQLIGPDTVNTVPPATLSAFLDHGTVRETLTQGLTEAQARLAQLTELGIDLEKITQELQAQGVESFAKSFESLRVSIAGKRHWLQSGRRALKASLSNDQGVFDRALARLKADRVIGRIWAHDYTVWKPEPAEISNRLGWLNIAQAMAAQLPRLEQLARAVHQAGYGQALLLGMGGSSLAPELFSQVFGPEARARRDAPRLDLAVLDSTDPGAILDQAERLDLKKTLFIVSTKSGTTIETLSFFKFFYNRVAEVLGPDRAGEHFIAITDPGSPLIELAERYKFREIFLNDPNIGGRYSALSYFGLVPAALVGVELEKLLDRALTAACNCEACNCPIEGDNAGARLGVALGALDKSGRDKLTLIASPPIAAYGAWAEQLIAESTGKEGQGILPVADEPLGAPDVYGDDRLFVYLRLEGDETYDAVVSALIQAGQPVLRLNLRDLYDLGGQFFLWEMATAVAGHILGINPFDQPNVEAAKVLARQMVATYQEKGTLPTLTPALQAGEISVYTDMRVDNLQDALSTFLERAKPGDYIALQAYLQPTEETSAALQRLRTQLRDRLKLATTVGYGPRFLHSTGQLHKGDGGRGLFIQIVSQSPQDLPIPDEAGSSSSSLSFGLLKAAQSLGDRQALLDAGRRVIRFELGQDIIGGLKRLEEAIP